MSAIKFSVVACNRYYSNAFHQEITYSPAAPKDRFDDLETASRRADALQAEFPGYLWQVNKHEGGYYECIYCATIAAEKRKAANA